MPGIYGCFNLKSKSHISGNMMVHETFHHLSEKTYEGNTLGVIALEETENVVFENDIYLCSFYGEIFEVLEKESLQKPVCCAEQFISLIQQYGEEKICDFNGAFIAAFWNKKKARGCIINDRFGLYPLYYRIIENGIEFASEPKALFGDCVPEPDYVGIAEFLSFDYCLEERTFFEGINYLSAAARIEIVHGKPVSKNIYYTIPEKPLPKTKTKKEYEKELYKVIGHAVEIRKDEKVCIGLTGGFDSRLILSLLGQEKIIETFNYGNEGSGDVEGAKELAKIFHTNHHRLIFSKDDFIKNAHSIVECSGGKSDATHFYQYVAAKEKRKVSRVEMSGTGGDAISGQKSNFTGLFPNMERRVGDVNVVKLKKKMYHNIKRGRIASNVNSEFLGKIFNRGIWETVEKDFDIAFGRCRASTFGNLEQQLKMRTMERLCTASAFTLVNQFITVRYPIYDYHVVDFFATMPQKYRYGQRLYIRMIQDYCKKAAKARHSETGRPVHERDVILIDWLTVWNFVKSKLGFKKRIWSNSFGFVREIIAATSYDWVKNNLEKVHQNEKGIFQLGRYESITNLCSCAKAGDGQAYCLMVNILNMNLLDEVFFEGKIKILENN